MYGTSINQLREIMDIVSRIFKSIEAKEKNANKRKLSHTAYAAYLAGFVSLDKAEDFAKRGNKGRGFSMPTYAKTEVTA